MLNQLTSKPSRFAALMLALAGIAALAAVAHAKLAPPPLPAEAEPDLPALATAFEEADRPTTEERELLGQRFRQSVDARTARSFPSPTGKGWVFDDGEKACIAIPDPGVGYGIGCAPASEVSIYGVAVALIDPTRDRAATVALAPPAGGQVVARRAAGTTRSLISSAGVVTNQLEGYAGVTLKTRAGATKELALPSMRDVKISVDCGGLPTRPPSGSPITCK